MSADKKKEDATATPKAEAGPDYTTAVRRETGRDGATVITFADGTKRTDH